MIRLALGAALLLAAAPARADTPEQRLAAKGYTLPAPPKPVATYVTSVRTGNLLFLSGHGECDLANAAKGKLGRDVSVEQGRKSAENVGLCMLATIKAATGDLAKVKRFVRILGMVNSAPDFGDQPKVVNGFSDLMVVAFGEGGKAPRSAVGMAALPFNTAVEIEATVELTD